MLARALAKPSNLLVLDEPTNDLDLETLDVLEETLGDYAGTVILISHDRDFLDRVVNAVIVPEGDGEWNEYAGGYSDMLAQRGRDIALEAPASAQRKSRARKPRRRRSRRERQKSASASTRNSRWKICPKQMAALEGKITILQAKLEDPELFARDRKAFEETSSALAAAQAELHAGGREMAGAGNAARGCARAA